MPEELTFQSLTKFEEPPIASIPGGVKRNNLPVRGRVEVTFQKASDSTLTTITLFYGDMKHLPEDALIIQYATEQLTAREQRSH